MAGGSINLQVRLFHMVEPELMMMDVLGGKVSFISRKFSTLSKIQNMKIFNIF